MKNCIKGKSLKHYDVLKAAQEELKNDFFAVYPNYQDPDDTYLVTGVEHQLRPGCWKPYPLKYTAELYESLEHNDVDEALKFIELYKSKFPTACKLIDYFGDDLKTATYLVLEAQSGIDWHYDIENEDGKTCGIHIPLDIPEGDLGFEFEDEIIRWDDIFAWNSEKIHRAWNNSDKPRLIFLLDVTKESFGVSWE